MTKPSRGRRLGRLEAQVHDDDDALGFPRMVARIWGMVAAISYISSGGYLVVNSDVMKCTGTGIYMLVIGLLMLGFECPCFLLILNSNKCCATIDQRIPFWVKGVCYIIFVIPCLVLCFNLKTMLTSLTVIILALLYFFLTCLQGNARYKRLQGNVNAQLQQTRHAASVSYSTISHANATISAFTSAAQNKHHSVQIKKAAKSSGKKAKTKR